MQLWHHHDREAGLQHIRAHCVMEEPLLNLLCLCREVDLAPGWNPTLSAMQTIMHAGPGEILAYLAIWLPWPLREPEVVIRGAGFDMMTAHGAVVVTLQEPGDALPPGVSLPPGSEGRKRYRFTRGCFVYRPLPPHPVTGAPRTDTVVLVALDSKAVPISDRIMSFLLKVGAVLLSVSLPPSCTRASAPSAARHSTRPGPPRRAAPRPGPRPLASAPLPQASSPAPAARPPPAPPDGDVASDGGAACGAANPVLARMRERAALYLPLARSIDAYLASRGWGAQLPLLETLAGLGGGGGQGA
ncbi:MAG: hypothetical protein J3K34DRAFT_430531 [Monoraphidium minutum]|nr:MAG: hypothetical protein J3K34DRAFT_430531 [Monoraphidium minutum]